MATDLVSLRLRDRTSADMATAFRFIVDELLGFLQDTLSSGTPGAEQEKLCAEVIQNRVALANAVDRRGVGELVEPLLRLSRAALDRIRDERAETRDGMNALVALLRDAVAVIAGEGDVFSVEVSESLHRFNELRRLTDINQIKEGLAREVAGLTTLARAREQRWKATLSQFEERVATLEHQLSVSREEALVDALTGAGNRRAFERALEESLQPGRRQFVVALLDLDDFKRINDTLGHDGGDRVLRAVAETLTASLRSEDLVARIGGDEFALVISGVSLAQAENRMRSITARLAGAGVEPTEGGFTVSCGVAECSAGDTAESIVRRADQALYDAKRQGKNRVVTRSAPFIRDLRAS